MKKTLKNWWLVFDAFGVIPVWTIQHPKKEAQEAYFILEEESGDSEWFEEIKTIKEMEDKLHACYITISCDIEFKNVYTKGKLQRVITKISRVEDITLIPDAENPLF